MARSVCRAKNCYNTKHSRPDLSFFRFPKDDERCRMWLESVAKAGFSELSTDALHRNNYICAEHFEPHCFMNNHRKSLIHNAVPTLYKGKEDEDVNELLLTLHQTAHFRQSVKEDSGALDSVSSHLMQNPKQIMNDSAFESSAHSVVSSEDLLCSKTSERVKQGLPLSSVPDHERDAQSVATGPLNKNPPLQLTPSHNCILVDPPKNTGKKKLDSPLPFPEKHMIMYVPANQLQGIELFSENLFVDSTGLSDIANTGVFCGEETLVQSSLLETNDKSCQTDMTCDSLSQLEKECLSLRKALTMICHRRLIIKKSVT